MLRPNEFNLQYGFDVHAHINPEGTKRYGRQDIIEELKSKFLLFLFESTLPSLARPSRGRTEPATRWNPATGD